MNENETKRLQCLAMAVTLFQGKGESITVDKDNPNRRHKATEKQRQLYEDVLQMARSFEEFVGRADAELSAAGRLKKRGIITPPPGLAS